MRSSRLPAAKVLTSSSTSWAAPISRPTWRRSRATGASSASRRSPDRRRRSTSAPYSTNGCRSSAPRCAPGTRRRRRSSSPISPPRDFPASRAASCVPSSPRRSLSPTRPRRTGEWRATTWSGNWCSSSEVPRDRLGPALTSGNHGLPAHRKGRESAGQDPDWLRGVPEDGQRLGATPPLPFLWPRRVLRLVAEQARHRALPQDQASRDPDLRARGRLEVVLRRRSAGVISVEHLSKEYKVHRRDPGLAAALRSLVRRRMETVRAVDDITFEVAAGERVGFLGPNGAGKTTTLKVLSGLLHPTSGRVTVAGHTPKERARGFLQQITLVMGQKQQLLWDLPPSETFLLNRAIYDIPRAQYEETMGELTNLLDLAPLLGKPTRQLSLGERMKCELAVALLHRPRVLFLDEPTIGLDVSMQATVRGFVRAYNERFGATVLLTSHYMEDVAALCPRVMVIDKGRLIYDGALPELIRRVRPDKRMLLRFSRPVERRDLEALGSVIEHRDAEAIVQVSKDGLHPSFPRPPPPLPLPDLPVEAPPLEEVMRDLFARGAREGAA